LEEGRLKEGRENYACKVFFIGNVFISIYLNAFMDFIEEERKYIAQTYSRQPVLVDSGSGAWVKDSEGKTYLDFFSGLAVNNAGNSNRRIINAVCRQAKKFVHTSNVYYTLPQIELAKKLYRLSGGYKSFFCNSGAEANEAAFKLARKFTGREKIIAAQNSFHGRTFAALSATGQEKYKKGFGELVRNFSHVNYNITKELENAVDKKTAALILEPVQGEGGVIPAKKEYLKAAQELCEDNKALLILDEVQTAMGRCGEIFAFKLFGVEPSIFTLAKALGGGLPLGAMLAKEEVMSAFQPGSHASTFGGNPVACAASLELIKIIEEEKLCKNAKTLGEYLKSKLKSMKRKFSIIKDVRGLGLMIGIELGMPCKEIVNKAREKGLLINCTHENVIRLLPPLIIGKKEADKALGIIEECLSEI